MEYDDGRILCDERGLVIRWYGLFGGKKVPYDRIRSATVGNRPVITPDEPDKVIGILGRHGVDVAAG